MKLEANEGFFFFFKNTVAETGQGKFIPENLVVGDSDPNNRKSLLLQHQLRFVGILLSAFFYMRIHFPLHRYDIQNTENSSPLHLLSQTEQVTITETTISLASSFPEFSSAAHSLQPPTSVCLKKHDILVNKDNTNTYTILV